MSDAHRSFLVYRDFRYLKAAVAVSLIALVAYVGYAPAGVRNGGTAVGYALGATGAAIILWLTWFGVRKRAYSSTSTTVQGWLSAHVYFGIALILIATLHTGFEFGLNVHTLSYLLMLIVIVSGIFGVAMYRRCPRLMSEAMRDASRRELLEELSEATVSVLRLADDVGGDVHDRVLEALQDSTSGGADGTNGARAHTGPRDDLKTDLYAELSRSAESAKSGSTRALISQLGHRDQLLERLNRESRLKALLDRWLYVHVPVSIALLAALAIHVITVFAYW